MKSGGEEDQGKRGREVSLNKLGRGTERRKEKSIRMKKDGGTNVLD